MTSRERPLSLDRRSLLAGGLALGGAALLGRGAEARVRMLGGLGDGTDANEARTLVLLQLTGGNDGLSTIVPFGDDAYGRARTATRIAAQEVLGIDHYRGFHPALKGMRRHFDAGRVALVEGCGYPNPVRSHFKSYEIWHAASERGRALGRGWIGRLAETAWKATESPELVVHVGANAPFSVYTLARPPVIFQTPQSYRWAGTETEDLEAYRRAAEADARALEESRERQRKARSGSAEAIDRLRGVLSDANASSVRIRRAAATYRTETAYPEDDLGSALRIAAALIDARVGSRVISVGLPGFDSHNNQRPQHDDRMRRLDAALTAFLDDLQGRSSKVLIVAFSEFGRRVQENGSRGTDHGTAGPMLVLGADVKGGVYGKHPALDELDNGDLVFTTDFRSVYASVIERWFGADAAPVLGAGFATLPLV